MAAAGGRPRIVLQFVCDVLDLVGKGKVLFLPGCEACIDGRLRLVRQPAELVGRLLRHLSTVESRQQLRHEVLPDRVQPGQLRLADPAGLGDVVPHPAGELDDALVLQLVKQHLGALGLFGDLRRAHDPRGGVGVDQTQLPHGRGFLPAVHDAGDAVPEHLAAAVPDHQDGSPAPVAADHDVAPVFTRPHPEGLLQAYQLDVAGQFVQPVQAVEVVRIRVDLIDRDVLDLLLSSVRSGYALQHAGNIKRHAARLPSSPA